MASAPAHAFSIGTSVADAIGSGLAGATLGTIERRYGLLRCEEAVTVAEVFDRSGDLAVADRLAFVFAARLHAQVAVVQHDGWYHVVALDRPLTMAQACELHPVAPTPRLLSLVTERGISPLVAPLVQP